MRGQLKRNPRESGWAALACANGVRRPAGEGAVCRNQVGGAAIDWCPAALGHVARAIDIMSGSLAVLVKLVSTRKSGCQARAFLRFRNFLAPLACHVIKLPLRISTSCTLVFCLLAISCGQAAPTEPMPPEQLEALRDVAPFPVGVAFRSGHLGSAQHTRVVSRTFSSITAEYEMKMNPLSGGRGIYNWQAVDDLVSYAKTQDMQIHGHALIWHETVPAWLENFSGSDQEFEEAVKEYITTVVDCYKDDVVSWDVVNEAFDNNTGDLRSSVFRRKMGDDYIARTFQYARDADPDALLFYNDYGAPYDSNKRAAILSMVDDFQSRGIPLDGVGLQVHVTYTYPAISAITAMMDAVVSRGLKVHLSELDVRVNPDGALSSLTPARSQAQKDRVNGIVSAFMALPDDKRFAITMWGLRDPESWLIEFWGNPEWPLLFDTDFEAKPAYEGFLEALTGD